MGAISITLTVVTQVFDNDGNYVQKTVECRLLDETLEKLAPASGEGQFYRAFGINDTWFVWWCGIPKTR